MAVDLRCPNCWDNLGKDRENSNPAYCGNCGESNIENERGYDPSEDDDQRIYNKKAIRWKNFGSFATQSWEFKN